MVDNKKSDAKPATADAKPPNDTDAKERVTRRRQGTEKVASEADETAQLGDELGGPA
ncbi:hypothetical protein [Rhodopila sp.]|uniref:hypothetical protein n=1 Tax=Rhodopila sp. TaxID=2480087 RepID=UPI003D0F3D1E